MQGKSEKSARKCTFLEGLSQKCRLAIGEIQRRKTRPVAVTTSRERRVIQ